MSDETLPESTPLTPTQVGRVDEACDRFEAAWRAGSRPRIEDYLAGAGGAERSGLFAELLALELELRRRRGERPGLAEYLARFPGDAPRVAAAFGGSGSGPGGVAATDVDLPTLAPAPGGEHAGAEPGDRPNRFRILRPHARGGLGEVFVARDTELNR